ncbi:MAG: accessory gene regulator ArgB-like protein [Eubacteriales bacterium]
MHLTSVHSMAMTLGNVIAREFNYDNVKEAKISYGLEAIIGLIIKSVVFTVVPFWFGVLKQSLIAMFTIAFIRYASGGMHCKTFIGCLIVSTAVYVSIGTLAGVVIINDYLFYVFNIASFLIVVLKSPVDPPEKPIKTKQKRYVMKVMSLVILLFLIYIASNANANDIKNSIIFGVYFQILTLTGWDNKVYKYIGQLKLKAKEVN